MARAAARGETAYDVHPGVAMVVNWVATLREKTGRDLEGWLTLVRTAGPATESATRTWLKEKHGLGTNSAWWIAERAFATPGAIHEDTPDGYRITAKHYVTAMFDGAKAGLRPIFDSLVKLGRTLGSDVKVCPCKTIVPFFREHVFAQLKPSTRTRLDLGLALGPLIGQRAIPARPIDTGGFQKKDRVTHRIGLASSDEIDAEVRDWLRTAYELDAPAAHSRTKRK